ncbi:MAG: anaerobic ribonucleoside-triphosphate reductase activating protein [Clostridia bacterium]|nr:anaerobic ribonucleoside-triphosphate reductase activating protein [Clostridia bacterium]
MDIYGLEKLSLVDYEGMMCATVFTGGCNFNCPFCHNAGLIRKEVDKLDTKDVLNYLGERKRLLDAVTVSGGEPTLEEGLADFIKQVKCMGYKVKLDTNGTRPEVLKNLIEQNLLDYVAMDIKNNFEDYAPITGVCFNWVDRVKESLRILKDSNVNYELRTTLVKEYHKMNNILQLSEDLKGEKVLYLQKFVDSGNINQAGLSEIDKETAKKYQEILQKNVEKVVLRGY